MPIIMPYRKALKPFAKDLRNNMTHAETFLWDKIRRKQIHGVQFLRQKPIETFIIDFYAKEIKLAIEVDGGQHFTIGHQIKDMNRDVYLSTLGIHTLRFTNLEVLNNCSGVLSTIEATVLERLPTPPLKGAGHAIALAEAGRGDVFLGVTGAAN